MENFRLRIFRAVARHLNFRMAAEELLLTQSAVTQQIKTLESELDVPLFDRAGGRVALTRAGAALSALKAGVQMEIRMRNNPLFTNGHPGVKADRLALPRKPRIYFFSWSCKRNKAGVRIAQVLSQGEHP
jgi:hypothetical protein